MNNTQENQAKEFEGSIEEIIKKRRSVRTYENKALSEDLKSKLIYYSNSIKGPFECSVRFKLIEKEIALYETKEKIGTYGVISGAATFLGAAIKNTNRSLEELGYLFEKIVLYATSLGLGTCWLGGTFKRSSFGKVMELKEDEFLPIISPVGYPASRMKMVESMMRLLAGSDARKIWGKIFFTNGFEENLKEESAGKYAKALEMVRLAPSASNKQPWRIVNIGKEYHFYLAHDKGYAKSLKFDIQRIDMGIAMCHFELMVKELGIIGEWILKRQPIDNVPDKVEYIISWVEL